MDKVYYNMLTTMILGGGYKLTTLYNISNYNYKSEFS